MQKIRNTRKPKFKSGGKTVLSGSRITLVTGRKKKAYDRQAELFLAGPSEERGGRDLVDQDMPPVDEVLEEEDAWRDIPTLTEDVTEELFDLQDAIKQALRGKKRARKGSRDRSDAVERRVHGFWLQMKDMTEAYMEFTYRNPELSTDIGAVERVGTHCHACHSRCHPCHSRERDRGKGGSWSGRRGTAGGRRGNFDLYLTTHSDTYTYDVPLLQGDKGICCSILAQGLIPSSPWDPKYAVSIRVLEVFRLAKLRSPGLGMQAWLRTLADLSRKPYNSSVTHHFTNCFDLYQEILDVVDSRVKQALKRDSPNWRLKNCCPACTYDLEDEEDLHFSLLYCMDGNRSAQRVRGSVRGTKERPDPRIEAAGGDYFLSREAVNRWSKEQIAAEMENEIDDDPTNQSHCKDRWKNMSEDLTSKSWAIFDETGIFLALCRHGFTMKGSDMVRSGEQCVAGMAEMAAVAGVANALFRAKYPLSMAHEILTAFPCKKRHGGGYDCGCGLEVTIENSPLAPLAKENGLRMLVGAFHGHAHNRKCQLDYLSTYVTGLGLEDLEGCERKFSQTNALAKCTRYATVFHRRQAYRTYLAHLDTFDTYANLSKFLVNNYMQARAILDTEHVVHELMVKAGVTSEIMEGRLQEEKNYLEGLSREPDEETESMDYYKALVNLHKRRERFLEVFVEDSTEGGVARRHANESYDKALNLVQRLEVQMGIVNRWTEGDPEWKNAAELLANQKYRRAVDDMERLALQRISEFAKIGQKGLPYKIRTHIAKAMQVRSKAVRSAVSRYNRAAAALTPPGRSLKEEDIIEHGFLAEFDILRDIRGHIVSHAWATPAARTLLDSYHKLKRAKEEIQRLNIEIKRFVTYMDDEKELLLKTRREVEQDNPILAFFIRRHGHQRGRFNTIHMEKLRELAAKLGDDFTGSLEVGTRLPVADDIQMEDAGELEGNVEGGQVVEQGMEPDAEESGSEDSEGDNEDEDIVAVIDSVTTLVLQEDHGEEE
ncbi:hypothetical protein R3P38DRAFT_2756286 [Favolaschia claudopus]|uniref:CxC3 like cysteine cluster domain-containing protein n=1 Tax=Favolaschia claudopus TaxID=2862362 RepID=A0AAW0EGG9_9AGAR